MHRVISSASLLIVLFVGLVGTLYGQNVSFETAVRYPVDTFPNSVAVGDFNGDGVPDLAVANRGSGKVLLGNGDGTFQPARDIGVPCDSPLSLLSVAVADFNRDGKLDLAVSGSGDCFGDGYTGVWVMLGNGDGTFRWSYFSVAGFGCCDPPASLATADFNGDQIQDLAAANGRRNNVAALLGNGNGTFRYPPPTFGTASDSQSVAVGDFNGDGVPDLAVANAESGNVSVLLGNGDGTFQAAVNFDAGVGPSSIAVGDFNGDGVSDLAVANSGSNNVAVLLGNGDGTFQPAQDFAIFSNPRSVAVGDFNGDGLLDLAVADGDSNDVSILINNTPRLFRGGRR